ncbi:MULTISPECIES: DUF6470 family protein [Bacillus]|uniref:YviE n=2 Tax=Bacillus TaxID=1386 RepID=A0A0M4FSH8_9BACI|nr:MULTISPECIES: DUF6470 family protein [Bacillus]ALC82497.1 hypothetical protein AM592_13570 [Bacillus gobiensis]MBP1081392.1 multisubunit Na+/H+ antiporter MnhE subunit [Bacillus capparidis]MED1096065.1 DUF6470 family protein [Bacillus capparidis]
MQLPRLMMESTQGRIGITIRSANVSIEQEPADIDIKQPPAKLEITTTPGKLTIDQTQAWEDMDLKHIFRRIEEAANRGKQDVLEGMSRRASQGNEMMRIENKGNPMPEQAKQNSERRPFEFNIGFIPSHFSVKTNYEPAQVKVEAEPQKPMIEVTPKKPIIGYSPGEVTIDMQQKPSLHIDVIPPEE